MVCLMTPTDTYLDAPPSKRDEMRRFQALSLVVEREDIHPAEWPSLASKIEKYLADGRAGGESTVHAIDGGMSVR